MHGSIGNALAGKSVLFFERSHVLRPELYEALEAHGASIVGPVCTIREAALLLQCLDIDGAILDRDLMESEEVKQLLDNSGVPSVYSCNEPQCRSGEDGCFRLHDNVSDPLTLLKALFQTVH